MKGEGVKEESGLKRARAGFSSAGHVVASHTWAWTSGYRSSALIELIMCLPESGIALLRPRLSQGFHVRPR